MVTAVIGENFLTHSEKIFIMMIGFLAQETKDVMPTWKPQLLSKQILI